MAITIDKPKTSKGYSYVLKSSWLQEAIIANHLSTNVHLVYWTPKINDLSNWSLIDAHYWLPNPRIAYPRFYIRVGVVPIDLKQQATSLIQTAVLPKLINWMAQQEKLDAQSTNLKASFQAFLKEGNLLFS